MAELNWTAEAERWLRDIYDYITEDNLEAAARVVAGIFEEVQLLRELPGHDVMRRGLKPSAVSYQQPGDVLTAEG